jgi:adhesin/invasin
VLRVTTRTTGQDQDADGYQFAVDGGDLQPIVLNGTTDLVNTAAGAHTVVLSNVAANCTVDDASQNVTVTANATATVAFNISCSALPPTAGSIRVTTGTSGQDLDPDGYRFSIDGGDGRGIGISGSETVGNIPAGNHTVQLTGVAANCSVNDDSQNVTVTPGNTATAAFAITCSAIPPAAGSIRVTTSTSGEDQDDGYAFSIDGRTAQPIGPNGDQTISNIPPGEHTVVLSGVAGNCTVNDDAQGVTVTPGNTATAAFAVTCTSTGPPPPSASRSDIDASAGSFVAGGSTTITVRVRDADGDELSGVPVTLSATGSGNSITPATATTDGEGEATFTFSSTVAERKVITATAGGVVIEDQATVDVVRAPSETQITSDENDPSTAGEVVRVTFTVVSGENGGTPTGQVTVLASDTEQCSAPVEQGFCDITLTEPGVDRTLIATYSGDSRFEDSSDTEPHTVVPVPAATSALLPR